MDFSLEDFTDFVANRPPEEEIDHHRTQFNGIDFPPELFPSPWAGCAVGAYVSDRLGVPQASLTARHRELNTFVEIFEHSEHPAFQYLNNRRPKTYGELAELLQAP